MQDLVSNDSEGFSGMIPESTKSSKSTRPDRTITGKRPSRPRYVSGNPLPACDSRCAARGLPRPARSVDGQGRFGLRVGPTLQKLARELRRPRIFPWCRLVRFWVQEPLACARSVLQRRRILGGPRRRSRELKSDRPASRVLHQRSPSENPGTAPPERPPHQSPMAARIHGRQLGSSAGTQQMAPALLVRERQGAWPR